MPLPAFQSLPRKNQLAIAYGVPAAIAVLLGYWAWKDLGTLGKINPELDTGAKPPIQRNTPTSLWTEINTLVAGIAEQQAIIDRGADIDKKLMALQGEIKAAQERLPQESEKAEMRDMIERLAREIPKDIGTVELKSVVISDNGDRGDTRTITYQVEITGDQDGIIKYIDSLEKNTRFMAVNTLSIHSGGMTMDPATKKLAYGLHSVHMDIITYVYNPKAQQAQPAQQ